MRAPPRRGDGGRAPTAGATRSPGAGIEARPTRRRGREAGGGELALDGRRRAQADPGDRGAIRAAAGRLEHDRARLDRPAGQARQAAGAEGVEARVGQRRAGEHGRDRAERERDPARDDGGDQRGEQRPADAERRREQTAGEREQDDVARMGADDAERDRRPPTQPRRLDSAFA